MHAILAPVGSEGDVNPFLAIGGELRRRGHRVSLIAAEVFRAAAAATALDFVGVGTAEDYRRVTMNPDLWHPRRGPRVVFAEVGRHLRDSYAALEALYRPGETIVVAHLLAFFARVFEERRRAPTVTVHLAPGVLRSDFAQPAMPGGGDISAWPRWAKRAVWWAIDRFALDPLIAPALNAWRRELGLAPVSRVLASWLNSPQQILGLFPDWFAVPQPDWPAQLRMVGFVLKEGSGTFDSELQQGMTGGSPPIVFTPGSANRHAAEFFRAGIDATARLKRRAVLVTGFREHLPPVLPDHAQHLAYAPFADLFPRAAAIVHHGGIGTCAQGLAAGVPQLIMPMGFDQPDNAMRLKRLGVSDTIVPARFTAARVAAALEQLLASRDVVAACRHWQERIDPPASVTRACEVVEQTFERARR